ncbi:hypothetical protein M0R19_01505 [Candidatus Pacearchaeota archaeon]|nr:hypothetical protein [Candidatus Pacearchaeota archaeon]
MDIEIIKSVKIAKKYLKEHPKDNFELEGLSPIESVNLKKNYFGNYNVEIQTFHENPALIHPSVYYSNSRLIISNKGVRYA